MTVKPYGFSVNVHKIVDYIEPNAPFPKRAYTVSSSSLFAAFFVYSIDLLNAMLRPTTTHLTNQQATP